jgi:hypothetical protein
MTGRKGILSELFPNNGGIAVMFEKLMDQMGTNDPVEVMQGINSGDWTLKPTNKLNFKIWKTIKTGMDFKPDGFKATLKKAECGVSIWGEKILKSLNSETSEIEEEIDLVNISVGELGFTKAELLVNIYKRALIFGLKLCPPEVGPQLRLQYTNQPHGEYLLIAMQPCKCFDGDELVFSVESSGFNNHNWLNANYGSPDASYNKSTRLIFRLPSKK